MTAHQPVRGDVAVLVPAAGAGTRLGPGIPKALREVDGEPLLIHVVRRIALARSVGALVVAAPADRQAEVTSLLNGAAGSDVDLRVVVGGSTRQASVFAALQAVPAEYSIILVHDAARALAPPELIERVAAAVRGGHRAVIPVLPVIDTVKQIDDLGYVLATVDRSALRLVQTPQGFARASLVEAHRCAVDDLTDDAGLAERIGVRVHCVPGDPAAFKITAPEDLAMARALLAAGLIRRSISK